MAASSISVSSPAASGAGGTPSIASTESNLHQCAQKVKDFFESHPDKISLPGELLKMQDLARDLEAKLDEAKREAPSNTTFLSELEKLRYYRGTLHAINTCMKSRQIPGLPSEFHASNLLEILEKVDFCRRSALDADMVKGGFASIHSVAFGAAAFVEKVVDRTLDDPMGIKTKGQKNGLLRELASYLCFSGSTLIPFSYATVESDGSIKIGLPRGESSLLDLHLRSKEGVPIEDLRSFLFDVLSQLNELHSIKVVYPSGKEGYGFVHNDIKVDNIVILDGRADLIDFGATKLNDEKAPYHGTTGYDAPEKRRKQLNVGTASDIWSFGIVCCGMLLGETPFNEHFIKSPDFQDPVCVDLLVEHFFKKETRQEKLKKRDPEGLLLDIIRKCLKPNPDERPTASELMAASFFSLLEAACKKEPATTEKTRIIYANPKLTYAPDLRFYGKNPALPESPFNSATVPSAAAASAAASSSSGAVSSAGSAAAQEAAQKTIVAVTGFLASLF